MLYDPWVMGHGNAVQHCTAHGSWMGTTLYDLWVMGWYNIV